MPKLKGNPQGMLRIEGKPQGNKKTVIGKPDWDLLPIEPLEEIIKALTDGNVKYERDNWKLQTDAGDKVTYYNAAMRHLTAVKKGEVFIDDPRTDIPVRHLAALGANVLIMLWHELERERHA